MLWPRSSRKCSISQDGFTRHRTGKLIHSLGTQQGLKKKKTEPQLVFKPELSKVASCRRKSLPTWLVSASYSAWHFFTDGVF